MNRHLVAAVLVPCLLAFFASPARGQAAIQDWTFESDVNSAYLGSSVASAGDVNGDGFDDVIIGAPNLLTSDGQQRGKVFVFHGSAGGLPPTPSWTAEGEQHYAYFGASVSTAGDVNGDGFDDIIVGAPFYKIPLGADQSGRVYVYLGGSGGLAAAPAWTATMTEKMARFGWSVARAGDVNNDGISDVIVGAPYNHNSVQTKAGKAYVYHGHAPAGGNPGGLSPSHDWIFESTQAANEFGISVASAGDVDGDGVDDVIVGADRATLTVQNEGAAYVFHGHAISGLSPVYEWSIGGGAQSTAFGNSVASAGDVDGDGYADVIVGAPYASVNAQNPQYEGKAFVYHGDEAGLPPSHDWTAAGLGLGAGFGWSVSSAGDVDADGISDIIVGATTPWSQDLPGQAFIYRGQSGTGLAAAHDTILQGTQAGSRFGWCVASAGDVDRSGATEVIVGVLYFDNGNSDEGMALVRYGINTPPVLNAASLAQFTPGGTPIPAGGFTKGVAFVVRGTATDSSGGPVRLQVRFEPTGTPITDTSPSRTGTPAPGGSTASVLVDLDTGAYHWRACALDVANTPSVTVSFGTDAPGETDVNVVMIPPTLSSLGQFRTTGDAIGVGGSVFESEIRLQATATDADGQETQIEVEVRQAGTPFLGVSTGYSTFGAGGVSATATAALAGPASYVWQARAIGLFNGEGAWQAFGGNPAGDADFKLLPPGSQNAASCGLSSGAGLGVATSVLLLALALFPCRGNR